MKFRWVTDVEVEVSDDPDTAPGIVGACDAGASPPVGSCANFSGFYQPSSTSTAVSTAGRLSFNDQVTATASSPLGGTVTPASGGDTCAVCPPNSCAISGH